MQYSFLRPCLKYKTNCSITYEIEIQSETEFEFNLKLNLKLKLILKLALYLNLNWNLNLNLKYNFKIDFEFESEFGQLQFMNKVFVFSINFTIRVSANSSGYMVFNLVFNFAIIIICDNTLQLFYYLLFIHIFTYQLH